MGSSSNESWGLLSDDRHGGMVRVPMQVDVGRGDYLIHGIMS